MRLLALIPLFVALTSCATSDSREIPVAPNLEPATVAAIDAVLDDLYRSFGHAEGGEPDWALMRAQFANGALFAGEAPAGRLPEPQTVDDFIEDWRAAQRRSGKAQPAQGERIVRRTMSRVGRLVRVDVVFRAEKAGDPHPRRPGLDSLTLAKGADGWRVLSFIVHEESKL